MILVLMLSGLFGSRSFVTEPIFIPTGGQNSLSLCMLFIEKPETAPRLPPERMVQGNDYGKRQCRIASLFKLCRTGFSLTLDKPQLRTYLRQQRQQLSAAQRDHFAKQLLQQIISTTRYQRAQHLALYLANDAEINPEYILQHALAHKKNCYLPVLSAERALAFMPYTSSTPMTTNRYGISEPLFNEKIAIAPQQLDMVLVPLVAFDVKGHRLGMGGGFYDKTFAFVKNTSHTSPLLIGLGYEFQKVATVPQDTWDIDLTGIITDQAIYGALT